MNFGSNKEGSASAVEKRESGQAAVEFALILPIMLLIVFAGLQFGFAYWQYQQLSSATSEGLRVAIVSGGATDPEGDVENAVIAAAPTLDPASLNVSVSSTWGSGDDVTVSVDYPLNVTIMGVTWVDQNVNSTKVGRVM